MVNILGENNSLFNQFIAEIRDVKVQKDPLRFRRNLERVGEIFAYELSKDLEYEQVTTKTPLGDSVSNLPKDEVVVASILRAGLPLHIGVLNYFDRSENAFISAYRKYDENGEFIINIEYIASPSIEGKVVVLVDPMLATGGSMVLAYEAILSKGNPKHVHIVSIIASQEGIEYVQSKLPADKVTLWMGAVDKELDDKSYIIPGCGDAGDLAYGSKLDSK